MDFGLAVDMATTKATNTNNNVERLFKTIELIFRGGLKNKRLHTEHSFCD